MCPVKTIHVVAAIIRKGDKIFATQRGYVDWLPADVEVEKLLKFAKS